MLEVLTLLAVLLTDMSTSFLVSNAQNSVRGHFVIVSSEY